MKVANLSVIAELLTIILFSLVLVACGGGSADSYNGSAPANTGTAPPPIITNAPTVTLAAVSTSIAYNASTAITWSSTNSSSCASTGGGGSGTTGSFNTGALTNSMTYVVTCGSASNSITITVAPSVITAFADAGGGNVTVTTANNLSSGTTISISGTTNYNGTYAISNANSTSFTIVKAFSANDATGAWQMAGGMQSGCTTSGATSAITLSNVPSRFTGVAPLSVFFDAAGTTVSNVAKRPFHDLEYRWNFGEDATVLAALPGSANWTNGSTKGSRNTASGPEAAHVFETPGVYSVTLSATDGTNTVTNSCAQIVVQNPDVVFAGTNTICVAATSLPLQGVGGCPVGAIATQQASFTTAINTYALTGKRVLFKRGDTFAAATSASIIKTGPGIIGAFSTGAAPIVRMTGNDIILNLSSKNTPGISDWRVMDLELDGMSKSASAGTGAPGGINQVTLLRLNIHDAGTGIAFSNYILDWWNSNGSPGHTVFDQVAIVDSTISRAIGGNGNVGVLLTGKRLSMMGSVVDDSTFAEHVIRIFYLNKGVLSNNTLSKAPSTKHVIKLHGPTWIGGSTPTGVLSSGYTEQVVLSDNKFVGASNPWTVAVGPQDSGSDERLRNIIIERNWFTAGAGTQTALLVWAVSTTVRNNICDMTGAQFHQCIEVARRGIEPSPNNVQVYNNTFYSGSAGDFIGTTIGASATNISVINNLGSAPSATGPVMLSGTGASGLVQSNNILNNSPSALFVNATPSIPVDFNLKSLPNPARETGLATIDVLSDFFLANRPKSGTTGVTDIGAIEGI